MKNIPIVLLAIAALAAGCGRPSPRGAEHFLADDIDTSVSPGRDFFRYANGRWLAANPIPASERGWGVGNLVQEETYARLRSICEDASSSSAAAGSPAQKIGDYYFAALDTATIERAGIAPLRADLDRIDAISGRASLLAELAVLQTYGAGPLFSPFVAQDEKNSAAYSFHLWQGGLGLPNRDYYVNTDARTAGIRREYVAHVGAMLGLLGENPDSAAAHAAGIMAIETALAKASRKLEDLRDPYRNYHKLSLRSLGALAPALSWATLLPAMAIRGADSVVVGQPEFYAEVGRLLSSRAPGAWKEYLRWTLVNRFASTLGAAFEREHFHFYQTVLSGVREPRPRWKRALDAEERAMGDMLGQLFVARYVSPSMKARYTKLVDDIFAAYAERIRRLDWMSEATRTKALAKLSAVTRKVCYPDKWKDYSALVIDRSSFCANQMRADVWEYNYYAAKLGKPVDRTEWEMTPQTYNAYYNPSNNEIVLPAAGLLIPGVPDSLVDDAVIYGYAGASTIGHEVTHGFDDEGRQFDAAGNLRNWWTPEDEKRFNARAKLMVDQFNGYVVLDSLHVNGKACLGENIADLGGVLIGYDAFKKTHEGRSDTLIDGLTGDQRFFLAYAYSWLGHIRDEGLARQVMTDVHAPQFLRVNGPLANVPAFYSAFALKPGDPMERPDSLRVSIW
ncbi:MAG TPA: M13 family metallopeptidase [Bacteroidota bacterium]|nr:M13 family metallopeptidase [Bacteroidota bacterium]